MPRRFPLSGLACFLSGDLAPQDLWNSKKIEKAAALVALLRIWRCCKLPRRSACLALRASSVETLRHMTCPVRKRSRGGLQHPSCA
jgi:hypothetical protein